MGVSPLQLVNLHRNRRYFVIKLHTWFCLSYFLKTNIKFYCIYQYFMSINSFFQHRICFSIQLQLQLVNLHRNRRYFVIKLRFEIDFNVHTKERSIAIGLIGDPKNMWSKLDRSKLERFTVRWEQLNRFEIGSKRVH